MSKTRLDGLRKPTVCHLALIVAAVATWTSPTIVTAAADLPASITVRVYQNVAALPTMLEQRALAEAGTVLRAARVDVRWRECTGSNASAACDGPPEPSELLLVVRGGGVCRDTPLTLGNAIVGRGPGGVLANVYFGCVERLARLTRTDIGVLLGRVAAHELGHLMMRSSAHATHGLMRPHWTPDEVRRNSAADWVFTAGDVAAMRESWSEHSEPADCCVGYRLPDGID